MKKLLLLIFAFNFLYAFEDFNFEKCIRKNLNVSPYIRLSQVQLDSIKHLECDESIVIKSFMGIDKLRNLETINAENFLVKKTQIQDGKIMISGLGLGLVVYEKENNESSVLVREGLTELGGRKHDSRAEQGLGDEGSLYSGSSNNKNGNVNGQGKVGDNGGYIKDNEGENGSVNTYGNNNRNPETNRGNHTQVSGRPSSNVSDNGGYVSESEDYNGTVTNTGNGGSGRPETGGGIIGAGSVMGETEGEETATEVTTEDTEDFEIEEDEAEKSSLENKESGGCSTGTFDYGAKVNVDLTVKKRGIEFEASISGKDASASCSIIVILPPNPWDCNNPNGLKIDITPANPWTDNNPISRKF